MPMPASVVGLFTHYGVTLVAYRHDVKRDILAFRLFRNSVRSDEMSDKLKISKSVGK